MTKGGVMIGRMVRSRSPFLKGKRVRVATSAKARPSAVEPAAVMMARNSVRHATPQRAPPRTQSRLQIDGSTMLREKPSKLTEPSKS
ncbi:hypothetical protein D3C80_1774410 [compost metagenome]